MHKSSSFIHFQKIIKVPNHVGNTNHNLRLSQLIALEDGGFQAHFQPFCLKLCNEHIIMDTLRNSSR